METLTFVQGVFSVIGILVVVGTVWAINQIVQLKSHIGIVELQVDNLEKELNLRVDGDLDEVNKTIDQMYRDMDSRFDKFENRITKKQLLND